MCPALIGSSSKTILKSLSHFVDMRLACEMIDISGEEIEKWQHEQIEMLKEHPEIAQVLIAA